MKRKLLFLFLMSVLVFMLVTDDVCLMMTGQEEGVAYAMGLWPSPNPRPKPKPVPTPQPTPAPSPVPEPSTLALIGTGVAGIGFYLLGRRRIK